MNRAKKRQVKLALLSGVIAATLSLSAKTGALGQVGKQAAEPSAPAKPASQTGTIGRALTYNPPVRGNPSGRVGGGTRGGNPDRSVVLSVLTPEHVGLTTKEQPTLYWYMSQPTSYIIELTVIENKAPKPLLETRINPPAQAGIQKVRLADHNVRLKTGTQYRWYIAMVADPKNRSKDILAGGFIERIDPSEALRTRVTQGGASQSVSVYAEEGIWYDALAALSDTIDAAPSDANLRAQRASLLEQVRLQQVADFDRGSGK